MKEIIKDALSAVFIFVLLFIAACLFLEATYNHAVVVSGHDHPHVYGEVAK